MYEEKKAKEDSSALTTVYMPPYKNSRTTLRREKKDSSQRPVITLETYDQTGNKNNKTRKQKWKENNFMNISSDKLTKLDMRKFGHYYKKETSREIVNLL